MKITELHNQPVQADTYEASMALNQLLKIGKHAIKIHNMIDDSAEMEAWVAKKIDLAGDYVKKVHGYMQGEKAGLYDDGGLTEEKSPQEKLAIMSKIEKIKKQSRDLTNNKDRDLINRNKELLAKLVKQLHEDAPFGSAMDLVRMAVLRKFISAEEYMNYGNELKAAAQEVEEKYADWPEGEGFGSSDGNFAIKDLMTTAGYEFDEQDRGGRFIVTKMPEKLEKMGIKNVRMRDAVTTEDAGEGHMSKSTLYHTAKYAIELMSMIRKGDDLEGWVQSKLNKAADYLQGVHNYEEYQKLNPYREELDSELLQRHAGIIQKNIDEILARETSLDDVDTKPGMMRILAKRVNEVEKEIAKEQRKDTDEEAPPGREKQVKALKKKFKDKGAPYAIAWAQHNKHGKPKKEAEINEIELEEGLKDWARNLAMAGVIVAGLAGVGSIQDAIDRSVPAVQAMETALEMAQDQGNDELAKMIEKDLSAVKVRLSSGKDLNFVKGMQEKYSKFIQTEGLTYESKLAVRLEQRIK